MDKIFWKFKNLPDSPEYGRADRFAVTTYSGTARQGHNAAQASTAPWAHRHRGTNQGKGGLRVLW